MEIRKFILGPIETNAYLLLEKAEAVLIDAPHGALKAITPVLEKTGAKLRALFLTHGHWDHISDARRIQDTGVKVYAHSGDRTWIEDPSFVMKRFPMLSYEGIKIDHIVKSGEILELIGEEFEVRHVPGHAPGNVLFYNAANNAAFVGDVIFARAVGRTDLPGGSFDVLEKSIKEQVYTLPDDTVIYSGHGPETTVGEEKKSNPYVKI